MNKLSKISIAGWRSIKQIDGFEPGQLNILIGANGAGKSNLISFFTTLRYILSPEGHLQTRVGYLGGAGDLLHYGPDVTTSIEATLVLTTDRGENQYSFGLQFAKPNRLLFSYERFRFLGNNPDIPWTNLGRGHEEALLPKNDKPPAKAITKLINQIAFYQFHNTSDTARLRLDCPINDGAYLRSNGENLVAVLYNLRQKAPQSFERISNNVRAVLPFFDAFVLEDDFGKVMLKWREKGMQKVFNAGQASDGMLRVICLFTLLYQPAENLPDIIFIDEPELGLHPEGIELLCSALKKASHHAQIFVCTQSIQIVNGTEPEQLVIINRKDGQTTLEHVSHAQIAPWEAELSMSEIWEKNIFGGRP